MKFSDVFTGLGRPVVYYPSLNAITGGVGATVFLANLFQWSGTQRDPDGWIYKTQEEIEAETGLMYSAPRSGLFASIGDARPRAVRPLSGHARRPRSPASPVASRFALPDAGSLSGFPRAESVAAAAGIPLARTCSVSPASTA
jgi:hypothetical protein